MTWHNIMRTETSKGWKTSKTSNSPSVQKNIQRLVILLIKACFSDKLMYWFLINIFVFISEWFHCASRDCSISYQRRSVLYCMFKSFPWESRLGRSLVCHSNIVKKWCLCCWWRHRYCCHWLCSRADKPIQPGILSFLITANSTQCISHISEF